MSYILKLVLKSGKCYGVIHKDPEKLKAFVKNFNSKEIILANVYHEAGAFIGFVINGKIVNYKLEEVL